MLLSVSQEEIEDLTKEVRLLTKRLNRLRREHASLSRHEDEEEDDDDDAYVEDQAENDEDDQAQASVSAIQPPLDRNANLRRTVRTQQRRLWGAHSLLLDWVVRPASFVLSTAHQPSLTSGFPCSLERAQRESAGQLHPAGP